MDWGSFLATTFGAQGQITLAVLQAEANPTGANVRAVSNAYRMSGQIMPSELLAHLEALNRQYHPEDPAYPNLAPWLLLGALALVALR